jgi:hypothetical protein
MGSCLILPWVLRGYIEAVFSSSMAILSLIEAVFSCSKAVLSLIKAVFSCSMDSNQTNHISQNKQRFDEILGINST